MGIILASETKIFKNPDLTVKPIKVEKVSVVSTDNKEMKTAKKVRQK